jgi:monoamine oxidase
VLCWFYLGCQEELLDQRVVIIGAGLAGASAALRLAKSGVNSLVLEARDRYGGRAFLKPFAGNGSLLEYGGAWITPWQHRVRLLVEEHGLSLRPRQPVTARYWLRDGGLHSTGPTSELERGAHERILARVATDSMLIKLGYSEDEIGRPLNQLSFAKYLDRLNPPTATRHLFSAWWTVSGNGDPERVAASEFLGSCRYGGGLAEGMMDVWADTLEPGMAVLVERMLAAAGADVRFGHAVVAIDQNSDYVTLTLQNRAQIASEFCILALGINQLNSIAMSPALSNAKRIIVDHGHGGRSFKIWIKAVGVAVGTLVTGNGEGIEFAFAEREMADGATLIVGFGLMQADVDPGSGTWVRQQVGRLFPNAQVLASDWHNWVHDPFSRGTWVAAPVGLEQTLDAGNWQPEGRLYFASSDIAREQAGWFEAAVISGEDAADAVLSAVQT